MGTCFLHRRGSCLKNLTDACRLLGEGLRKPPHICAFSEKPLDVWCCRTFLFHSTVLVKVSAQNLCTVQSYEKLCCASADRAEPPLDLFVMSSPSRRYIAFCMRFTCCRVIALGSLQQPLLRACVLSSCAPSIARGRGERGREWGYKNESSHLPYVCLLAQRQVA